MGHMYDPSKFWIIIFIEKYHRWCAHLKQHHERSGKHVSFHKLKERMVYIVKMNEQYYRAIHLPNSSARNEIQVFLIDAGTFEAVSKSNVYFMDHQHSRHESFAVRARLHGVAPPSILLYGFNMRIN